MDNNHEALKVAVARAIREEEDRRWKRWTVAITVATTLLGGVGYYAVSTLVESQVERRVNESIGAVNDRLQIETTYQLLLNAISDFQLRMVDSIRAGELAANLPSGAHRRIMPLLRTAAEDEALLERYGFPVYLEAVVDTFSLAGLSGEINEIDALFRELLVSEPDLAFSMIEYYGQRVVGSGVPLEEVEAEHEALRQYMAQAPVVPRLTGVVHSWRLLVEYIRSGTGDSTNFLVESARELSGQSGEWFGCQLYWFSDATTWTQVGGLRLEAGGATAEGKRIERVYHALRQDYPVLESLERRSMECPPA